MNIQIILKEQRKFLGLTQQQLANLTGMSLATIQNIEYGKGNPEWQTINALLAALGLLLNIEAQAVPLDQLIPYGLPMAENPASTPKTRLRPTSKMLLVYLRRLSHRIEQKWSEREEKSLTAFFFAIKTHYPNFWEQLPPTLAHWLSKQALSGPVIKLRRVALARLGEYL